MDITTDLEDAYTHSSIEEGNVQNAVMENDDNDQEPNDDDEDDGEDHVNVIGEEQPNAHRTTRSGRVSVPPQRYEDYVAYSAEREPNEFHIVKSVPYSVDEFPDHFHLAFAASSDPDVLYLNEALKAPDRKEFIQAMVKEIQSHVDKGNWLIVNRSDIPDGKTVVPAVWAMRRKRDIETQDVYKWKARINFHGGKQKRTPLLHHGRRSG